MHYAYNMSCVQTILIARTPHAAERNNIRKDKTGKPYLMFSAFSTEKVNDGFEYQWVRFFCFGKEKEEWLQPGVKVDAKGEMSLSLYDGKPDISCRVEELNQYVPEAGNDNR